MVKTKNFATSAKLELIKAFKNFPNLCFIWKIDKNDFQDEILKNATFKAGNIFLRSWIPQQQLFADKRTKIFITHCGANSINEVFAFGVPVITIPLYLDNYHSSTAAVQRGLGVFLNKLALTKESMIEAITTILENGNTTNQFEIRATKMATQLKQSRKKIIDNVVEWSEKVINFGPLEHLTLGSTKLNLIQLYCLDIFIPIISLNIILIIALYHFLKFIFNNTIKSQLGKSLKLKIN